MLVYLEDAQKKKHLIEEEKNYNIGRDGSQCELKLPNNRLFSALQAIIVVQDDVPIIEKYVLVDQSSNKNTFVNCIKIDKKILKNGDRISFSSEKDFCLTFKINTSAATIIPRNEGYVKPTLEEQGENLLSTIKEKQGIDTPEVFNDIEDLNVFIRAQKTSQKASFETKDDICVEPANLKSNMQSITPKGIQIIGEETEVDLENPEKIKILQEAYEKMSSGKKKGPKLISVLDGNIIHLSANILICGSSSSANITFPQDAYITSENFKLIQGKDGSVINPLDNNNVIVNGFILKESQKLNHKDIIRVGKQILYYLQENQKEESQLLNSIQQNKITLKNFYDFQNAANKIDFSSFNLDLQTKFNEKENIIYALQKNDFFVYVFIGDLIGTVMGFALIAQELRGAFSSAVSNNKDLHSCALNFDRILKKYNGYNCNNNIPLLCKGLLLRLNKNSVEWLNMGGYLTPITIGQKVAELPHGNNTNLLGHFPTEQEIMKINTIPFEKNSVLILQPDCLPAKNTPKILLRLKDAQMLMSKLNHETSEVLEKAIKHLLGSNITSLIAIHRKSSKKCPVCARVLSSEYAFCPYDSAKLV